MHATMEFSDLFAVTKLKWEFLVESILVVAELYMEL